MQSGYFGAASAGFEVVVSVLEGVERDLARLAARDPDLACSGVAMLAVALARDIDDAATSPTARSMCARQLEAALTWLWGRAPVEERRDSVDDLAARRAARLAGREAGAGL